MMDKPPHLEGSKLINCGNLESCGNGTQHRTGCNRRNELKAERASLISEKVEEVWFINGNFPERLSELLSSGTTIGTKIVS